MNLNLRQTADGVELKVKALPGSRKNEFRGVVDGYLKVSVTAVAEKGKANKAIILLLSKCLGIPKSRFEILSGSTSSLKTIFIFGVESAVVGQPLIDISKN